MKIPLFALFLICSIAMAQEGGKKVITAEDVIEKLGLTPLPEEGGYFKETYRSSNSAPARLLGIPADGDRVASTAIYYLVTPKSFSALHKLNSSDEIFHFYAGDPVEMIQVDPNGVIKKYIIGSDIFNGQTPQVVVPKGTWQALRLTKGCAWALMGTTVAPGFEFQDFELGDREKLIQEFPQLRDDILSFSREQNESPH
jgi:predicted cupin superfamily sugar epimerase